jgi:superfamily II DNA/RNA helicase
VHKAALVDVAHCQGVVLGNVGVFVRASIDPEALKYSNSTLAQGLVRQGLVDAAVNCNGDGVPTLRAVTAEAIAEACRGEQLLVFSEDVRCLHLLAGTLRARGVDAHVGDGKLSDDEFEDLKDRFVAGAFPVLLLSRVGEKGHDLQNASGFVNLDVGWVTKRLEQRAGRVARPGSKFREVWSVIPYIHDGGVAYQVGIVAERGAENYQLFDGYAGVRASDSTIAGQLAEITAQVAVSRSDAGYAGDAARLQVAAAVFGA